MRIGYGKIEYRVNSSWLTRDHLKRCDNYHEYLARIDAFEQRLNAKLVTPRHVNWTFFGDLRGHRGRYEELGFDISDHPAAFDGGSVRYLVTQPYFGRHPWDTDPKIDRAREWTARMGFDTFEALDPSLGFWNPPGCHVFIWTKTRP